MLHPPFPACRSSRLPRPSRASRPLGGGDGERDGLRPLLTERVSLSSRTFGATLETLACLALTPTLGLCPEWSGVQFGDIDGRPGIGEGRIHVGSEAGIVSAVQNPVPLIERPRHAAREETLSPRRGSPGRSATGGSRGRSRA